MQFESFICIVVISETKKGIRSDSTASLCHLEAGNAADWNSTDRNAGPTSATNSTRHRERHPLVDHNRTTSTPSIIARIAVVDISDNSAANNGAEYRAEDRANVRTTAAHASIVTTRRPTARIGYRDRLRTRRNGSRSSDWLLSD